MFSRFELTDGELIKGNSGESHIVNLPRKKSWIETADAVSLQVEWALEAKFDVSQVNLICSWVYECPPLQNWLYGRLLALVELQFDGKVVALYDLWIKANKISLIRTDAYGKKIARELLGRTPFGRYSLTPERVAEYPQITISNNGSLQDKLEALKEGLRSYHPQWIAVQTNAKKGRETFLVMPHDLRAPIYYTNDEEPVEEWRTLEPCWLVEYDALY